MLTLVEMWSPRGKMDSLPNDTAPRWQSREASMKSRMCTFSSSPHSGQILASLISPLLTPQQLKTLFKALLCVIHHTQGWWNVFKKLVPQQLRVKWGRWAPARQFLLSTRIQKSPLRMASAGILDLVNANNPRLHPYSYITKGMWYIHSNIR